jgi:chorismate mutase
MRRTRNRNRQKIRISLTIADFSHDILRIISEYVCMGTDFKDYPINSFGKELRSFCLTCAAFHRSIDWTSWCDKMGIWRWNKHVPACLQNLFAAAIKWNGNVLLKDTKACYIPALALEGVKFKEQRLGRHCYAHLYPFKNILRVVAAIYPTQTDLDAKFTASATKSRKRQENIAIKEARQFELQNMLAQKGIPWRNTASVDKYVKTGKGNLNNIIESAQKAEEDYQKQKPLIETRSKRYGEVHKMALDIKCALQSTKHLPVISMYISDGKGTLDDVKAALVAESEAQKARRSHSSQRREQLIAELHAHGLELRPDSKFCDSYIYGDTSASLEEVVATMKLTTYLFSRGGHRCYSKNHLELKEAMESGVLSGKYGGWYEAFEAVKKMPF